ncbi:hypothetical protein HDU76_005704 [Blyttiomyces sp. JEL0837]|nr:hypothetical protein HDU76_005704 [Blyttiomyces sp. JEL0837]
MHFTSILAFAAAFATAAVSAAPTTNTTSFVRGMHYNSNYKGVQKPIQNFAAKLNYYGGPVIQNVEVTTIYYGNANYQSQIDAFYKAIVVSPWISWLSEYNTANPVQTIGTGSFVGSYKETSNIKTSLDDANDIQPYLKNLVSTGVIKPNANSYYPIHFAPGISITQGGSGSCSVFCAYHGTIDISSLNVGTKYLYYGVMPDQGGNCAGGCGSAATTFQNLCSVSSHELAEAMTDAAVGIGSSVAYPLAWYDSANGEIGDICNAQQGTFLGNDGVTYTVQAQWSNALGKCIVSKGTTTTSTTKSTTSTTKTTATSTTTKTSTTATTTTTGTTCAHSICSTGTKLTSSCDPCAAKIIAQDSYCGSTSWDSICVGEVKSICGITC